MKKEAMKREAMKSEVMKRGSSFYQSQQAMLNFGFVGKQGIDSPVVMALAVALEKQVSVTLDLRYRVYMYGEAIFSEGRCPDLGMVLEQVRGIEFERVRYADGVERNELYIGTNNKKFLAWCDDDGLTPEMTELLVKARAEKHELSEYAKYFTKINFKHPYYELTA